MSSASSSDCAAIVSPHWHDMARLDEAGLAEVAFTDRELAKAVARHKAMFLAEKAADQQWIDYGAAVDGALRLVPEGDALKALEEDYLGWSRTAAS